MRLTAFFVKTSFSSSGSAHVWLLLLLYHSTSVLRKSNLQPIATCQEEKVDITQTRRKFKDGGTTGLALHATTSLNTTCFLDPGPDGNVENQPAKLPTLSSFAVSQSYGDINNQNDHLLQIIHSAGSC